jgi:hypothetical protein
MMMMMMMTLAAPEVDVLVHHLVQVVLALLQLPLDLVGKSITMMMMMMMMVIRT